MDKKTVFVKTSKGESEVDGSGDALYGDAKRILLLVDDESTVAEITKRAPPSLRDSIEKALQELVDGAYVRDMNEPENIPQKSTLKFATPSFKMAAPKVAAPAPNAPPRPVDPTKPPVASPTPARPVQPMTMPDMNIPAVPSPARTSAEPAKTEKKSDLDFSFITSSGSGQSEAAPRPANDKTQADAAARTKQDAERLKAQQSAQIEATAKAAKVKAYEEAKLKAKAEVDTKAKIEAEIRIKKEAEARVDAEVRAKKEAEMARGRAEQAAVMARQELAATKARVEAEVRARLEAELKAKQEAEVARLRAEREAEKIRLELAAAKAKAEQEIKIRLEAEARARAEIEARLRREAEAERLRLEKERAELEMARIKAEAEIRMRTEAELRVRAEIEARLQAEALEQQRQLLNSSQGTLGNIGREVKAEQADPAEKVRQSFMESFTQGKKKQDIGSATNFKLEKFSMVNTGKIAALTVEPKKTDALPGAGTKVKAAIEQRAKKEAEAKRLLADQDAARIMAEQDAIARSYVKQEVAKAPQPDNSTARLQKEQDVERMKAEQAAYRKKVEQDEAQALADVESKKLAEQQGKQWDEAQRKAEMLANAEKERMAKEAAEQQKISRAKISRMPRKPLPIGKMLASLFVLALLAAFALPYVWPLGDYVAPIEKEISAQLNQPVKIKSISAALLPLPRLSLHDVTIGTAQELKVKDVVLNFDLSALFAATKSISKLELKNVSASETSLDKVLVWLQAAGGIEKYPVARMDLSRFEMKSAEIKLPVFSGRADFDPQGKFTKASLSSEDAKFSIELQSVQNRMQVEFNMRESSLPILTDIKFKDLSATGLAENGEIVFSDFFAHVYGGNLTGKGSLNWNNGWKLQGQINAKSLELKDMFPNFSVTGQLYGDVSVSMNGASISKLDDDPHMEGSFEAKNGEIKKLDLDTVARFGARQGISNRTSYTELSGSLRTDSRGQRFFLHKLDAGVVSGSGIFEVNAKDKLTGKLMVDIAGVTSVAVPLQLSGTPTEPVLQQGR